MSMSQPFSLLRTKVSRFSLLIAESYMKNGVKTSLFLKVYLLNLLKQLLHLPQSCFPKRLNCSAISVRHCEPIMGLHKYHRILLSNEWNSTRLGDPGPAHGVVTKMYTTVPGGVRVSECQGCGITVIMAPLSLKQ